MKIYEILALIYLSLYYTYIHFCTSTVQNLIMYLPVFRLGLPLLIVLTASSSKDMRLFLNYLFLNSWKWRSRKLINNFNLTRSKWNSTSVFRTDVEIAQNMKSFLTTPSLLDRGVLFMPSTWIAQQTFDSRGCDVFDEITWGFIFGQDMRILLLNETIQLGALKMIASLN